MPIFTDKRIRLIKKRSLKMIEKFKLKYGFTNVLLYGVLFAFMLFLNFTVSEFEPFSLCLYVAMLSCNLNVFISGGLYLLAALLCFRVNAYAFIAYAASAILFTLVFWIYSRLRRKINAELVLFAALALLPYFFTFARFVYSDTFRAAIVAIIIFMLVFVFTSALKCVLFKAGRARLSIEELISVSAAAVCTGTGLFNFAGGYVYDAVAIFLILITCAILKNASSVFCSLILAIPKIIAESVTLGSPNFSAGAIFVLYCAAALCFLRAGKLPSALSVFLLDVCVRFLSVFWNTGANVFTSRAFYVTMLVPVIPCVLFLAVPEFIYEKAANVLKLYSEQQLTKLNINANRQTIGEKLFELSAVFKEIENAFLSFDNYDEIEKHADDFALEKLADDVCSHCPSFDDCKKNGINESLLKLISIGCTKGKVNLIDLPQKLTSECVNPSGILFSLNAFLSEYRKSMLESENATAGKRLLAEQAKGISDVLKTLALEQSAQLVINVDLERRIRDALTKKGVMVNEISVYDEDNPTVSMTVSGKHDIKKIIFYIEQILNVKLTLSKKIPLAAEKYCYVLKPKPKFDAAFGVASSAKQGETASGDTHSVIKIDERTFMLALSDGMGSGEYAQKISDCAISLIESFYRAKMPTDTVLSTINRLLSFNKRESFSCVDTVTIDLHTGACDMVKIGSPLSFVLSDNKLKVLESESLPLGILDSVKPTVFCETLAAGDTVVLISDGISAAFSSSTDICSYLENAPCLNPQTFADELLNKAVELCGGTATDDMTVVAARIFENTD